MTYTNPDNYWISPSALLIELNALSNPNYILANTNSGAAIIAYVKDIIDYDAGHNFRRWPLVAAPTAFNSNTEKYVYVAIPRNESVGTQAMVVLPSERLDIYGKAEHTVEGSEEPVEVQVGSEDYYYIYLEAIITSSGEDGATRRDWKDNIHFDTGRLRSDEAISAGPSFSEWYEYRYDLVTFLKDMTMKAGTKFIDFFVKTINVVSGGSIKFTKGSVSEVADNSTPATSTTAIVTPSYANGRYLSKKDNDTAEGHIIFNKGVDIFGNTNFGIYNKGISGATIHEDGFAEFGEVVIRESLIVPQITYNNIQVIAGNTWRSPGGGTIEEVALIKNRTVGMLKLEDGQIGRIAPYDFCQGVWHRSSGNDTEDIDERNGNFHFSGFTTVYFRIDTVYDLTMSESDRLVLANAFGLTTEEVEDGLSRNMFFRYSLRGDGWTAHPQSQMDFAAYANPRNTARQQCKYTTPSYEITLVNMTGWTYNSNNIAQISGDLNGFTIIDRNGKTKQLEGWGSAIGKMYMWGNIEHIDRAPIITSQQLYFLFSNSAVTPSYMPGEEKQGDTPWVKTTNATVDKDNPFLWAVFKYEYDRDDASLDKYSDAWIVSRYVRDGNSITIRGSVLKVFRTEAEWLAYDSKEIGYYAVNGNDGSPKLYYWSPPATDADVLTVGTSDCYLNADDGHLWSAGDNAWVDAGNIKGNGVKAKYARPLENGQAPGIEFINDPQYWHEEFGFEDVYMRTSIDNGETWSAAMRVVGEEGAPGEHTDYSYGISQYETVAGGGSPADITVWNGAPILTTDSKPYLWMRSQRVDGAGNNVGAPVFMRLTGNHAVSYEIVAGKNVLTEGEEDTPLAVRKTVGKNSRVLTFEEADAEGIVLVGVGAAIVDWNDTDQQLWIDGGVMYGKDYTVVAYKYDIEVARLTIGVVKKGEQGVQGDKGDPGNDGKDAATISISAACHDGTSGQIDKCYVAINGAKIVYSAYWLLEWDETAGGYVRTHHSGTLPTYKRGFAFYYVNARTMECQEVDYYDTYGATDVQLAQLYSRMEGTANWYVENQTDPIILAIVVADAATCGQPMRDFLNKYGGSLSDTYVKQRRRHYFITNLLTAKAGQAYEEVSADPTQKIVTFNVNPGEGIILQGTAGADGTPGVSPHIGDNGNWWIGDKDTEIKATPDDPDVWTIGTDGLWYFNGVKTDKQALGSKGQAVVTSYAFRRSATKLTTPPSGGSFTSPHPTTSGWSDGVPSGSDPVYMSSRVFTSDGSAPQQTAWSIPCLMADTADIDIEYSAEDDPSDPQGHPNTTLGWHNEATEDDIWMAISSKVGGTWSDWQVTKIKGERGEKGNDGDDAISLSLSSDSLVFPTSNGKVSQGAVARSVACTMYKGTSPLTAVGVSVSPNSATAWNAAVQTDKRTVIVTPRVGETWTDGSITLTVVASDGKQSYTMQKTVQLTGSAQGQTVQGPQGASVTGIKEQWAWTDDDDITNLDSATWVDSHIDPTPQKPVIWNREVVTFYDPSTNKTSEKTTDAHICCTFSDGITEHTSLYGVTNDGNEPTSWTTLDKAKAQFSVTNRYFWNKEETKFKDTSKNITAIRLVAVWGQDGKSIVTVNNYYAWADSGDIPPLSWGRPNIIPSHTTGKDYLWNKEETLDEDGTIVSVTDPACIGYFPQDGQPGRGIRDVIELYQLTTTDVAPAPPTVNNKTLVNGSWKTTADPTTDSMKYLWNVEVIQYTDDSYSVGKVHVAGVHGQQGIPGVPGEPGQAGLNGADGVQPNLFGYDTPIFAEYKNICLQLVHTPDGIAAFIQKSADSTAMYNTIVIDMGSTLVTGHKYAVSFDIFTPYADGQYLEFKAADNAAHGSTQLTDLSVNTWRRFVVSMVAGKNGVPTRYIVFTTAHVSAQDVYAGLFRLRNLKIEDATELIGTHTAYLGLAESTAPVAQNILLDTARFTSSVWTKKEGFVIANQKDGLPAYSHNNWTNNPIDILEQYVDKKLRPGCWYTLSYYAKCIGQCFSYVYPDSSGYIYGGIDPVVKIDNVEGCLPWTNSNGTYISSNKGIGNSISLMRIMTSSPMLHLFVQGTSEANGDYFFVSSRPFTTAAEVQANLTSMKYYASGTALITQTEVEIPVEQSEMLYVGYVKDGSLDVGTDEFRFNISPDPIAGLRLVDGVVSNGVRDGIHRIEPSDDWMFHSVTFQTPADLNGSKMVMFRTLPSSSLTIAQLKLEEGENATVWQDNVSDRRGAVARPCGEYAVDATYVWNANFRDIVIYNGQYYSVKEEGMELTNIPPTSTEHWEQADKFSFVATDLLLAERAYIDNLGVRHVATSPDVNTARIEMSGSEFNIFGNNLATPSIKMAVRPEDGVAVLEFYNAFGTKMYDLGPEGIAKEADREDPSMDSVGNYVMYGFELLDTVVNTPGQITELFNAATTVYYRFTQGYKYVGSVVHYLPSDTDTPDPRNGKIYNSDALESGKGGFPLGTMIQAGYGLGYCARIKNVSGYEIYLRPVYLCATVGANPVFQSQYLYFRKDSSGNIAPCDINGNVISGYLRKTIAQIWNLKSKY